MLRVVITDADLERHAGGLGGRPDVVALSAERGIDLSRSWRCAYSHAERGFVVEQEDEGGYQH